MHIVFVCDDTTKSSDANLTICRGLAREFQARGHRVSFLGNCEHPEDLLEENDNGIRHYRFYYPINRITHEMLGQFQRDHSLLRLAGNMLKHPVTALVDIIRFATGYNPIENQYRSCLERLDRRFPVDLAIASSGSFYTINALAKSSIEGRRVGYMLDPYWKNCTTGGPRAKKEELRAWKKLDCMVIPKLLEEDYEDPDFALFCKKKICAEFPGISDEPVAEVDMGFDANKTNLVFAGNFYEKIRSPEYLLRLVDALPEQVCLHYFGGIYGSFGSDISEYMDKLAAQGKLIQHGIVPVDQARAAMRQADMLVNIGNAIDNQLPSKIFECFSTGKPLLHIQKISRCPCVPYMKRYGNAVILAEADDFGTSLEKFMAFYNSGLKTMEFEQVRLRFETCTIPYVADLFLAEEIQE